MTSREDKAAVQETLDGTLILPLQNEFYAYSCFYTVLFEISQLLNTKLDRDQLALCVSMIESGVNPDALAVSRPLDISIRPHAPYVVFSGRCN